MDREQAAIDAYLRRDTSFPERHLLYGAAASFTGIADNGGLMGGGVENCRETDTAHDIAQAASAFRSFGMADVAELIERADAEYVRMRPGGAMQELFEQEERIWKALDDEWYALGACARLDRIGRSL